MNNLSRLSAVESLRHAKDVARSPYAWPGGYPRFLVMGDGGSLCPCCVRAEFRSIAHSAVNRIRDGWDPACADINWEDAGLTCDHCGEDIPAAYA